jgi:nucleotidyltransferase/DNA polymerase involved in DNA repair
MEKDEDGQRRSRSTAPAAPSDWRSRMDRTIRKQAQELTQLDRTVGHLANLVEAQTACEQEQRLAMMRWMQERKQEWDARYEEDMVWGAGITTMIANTMKAAAQGQEETERE